MLCSHSGAAIVAASHMVVDITEIKYLLELVRLGVRGL
jgi:hypothetical protein